MTYLKLKLNNMTQKLKLSVFLLFISITISAQNLTPFSSDEPQNWVVKKRKS